MFWGKGNYDDIGISLDFRQENDFKNMTLLQRLHLLGETTSKPQQAL